MSLYQDRLFLKWKRQIDRAIADGKKAIADLLRQNQERVVSAQAVNVLSVRPGFQRRYPGILPQYVEYLTQVERGPAAGLWLLGRLERSRLRSAGAGQRSETDAWILFSLAWNILVLALRLSTPGQAITYLRTQWYRRRKSPHARSRQGF
jgi:hypothetical protein